MTTLLILAALAQDVTVQMADGVRRMRVGRTDFTFRVHNNGGPGPDQRDLAPIPTRDRARNDAWS